MVTTPGTLCFLEQFVEFFEGQLVCWVSKSGKFWEARIEGNQFWKSTCAYRTIKHQWTIVQPREHRQINIRLPERPMTSSNTTFVWVIGDPSFSFITSSSSFLPPINEASCSLKYITTTSYMVPTDYAFSLAFLIKTAFLTAARTWHTYIYC